MTCYFLTHDVQSNIDYLYRRKQAVLSMECKLKIIKLLDMSVSCSYCINGESIGLAVVQHFVHPNTAFCGFRKRG